VAYETQCSILAFTSVDGNAVMSPVGTVEKTVIRIEMNVSNGVFFLVPWF
jgi:hypothetical protein